MESRLALLCSILICCGSFAIARKCTVTDFDGRVFDLSDIPPSVFKMSFVLEHSFVSLGDRLFVVDPCEVTSYVPSTYDGVKIIACDPPGNMNQYSLQTGRCENAYRSSQQPPPLQMSQGFIWVEMHSVYNGTRFNSPFGMPTPSMMSLTSSTANSTSLAQRRVVLPPPQLSNHFGDATVAGGVGTCFNLVCGSGHLNITGPAFYLDVAQEYGWVAMTSSKLCAKCLLSADPQSDDAEGVPFVDLRRLPPTELLLEPRFEDGTSAGPSMLVDANFCEISLRTPKDHWNDYPGNVNFYNPGTSDGIGQQLALWSNHQPMMWTYVGGAVRQATSAFELSHPSVSQLSSSVTLECPQAGSPSGLDKNRTDLSLWSDHYTILRTPAGKVKGWRLRFETNLMCSLPISPSSSAKNSPPHDTLLVGIVAGCAGGFAVVCAVVVVLVVLRRKKSVRPLEAAINSDAEDRVRLREDPAIDVPPATVARPVITIEGIDYHVMSDQRPLGRGSFGTVYRGMRTKDRYPVAVKYAPVNVLQQQFYKKAMVTTRRITSNLRSAEPDEAEALQLLPPHKHLIEILGIMAWDASSYTRAAPHNNHPLLRESCLIIVTPLLECGDLHRYIRTGGSVRHPASSSAQISPRTPSTAASTAGSLRVGLAPLMVYRFGAELCDVVHHLHENRVVHRDIKPENILLYEDQSSELHVSLTDFGMAKVLDSTAQTLTTQAGTPAFLAPECFSGKYKSSADTFSVGCVLFAMASGYVGKDAKELWILAEDSESKLLDVLRKGFSLEPQGEFPQEFLELLRVMLLRDPESRISLEVARDQLLGMMKKLPGYGATESR